MNHGEPTSERYTGDVLSELLGGTRFFSGKTPAQCAKDLGVTSQTYVLWESGIIANPHPRHRRAIAEALVLTDEECSRFETQSPAERQRFIDSVLNDRRSAKSAHRSQLRNETATEVREDVTSTRAQVLGALITRVEFGPPLSPDEVSLLRSLVGLSSPPQQTD